MFGHVSAPSRIWSYGAKAPVDSRERVEQQMLLGHRYRNALCALERERRAKVDEAMLALCPELATIDATIAQREVTLEESRKHMRANNAETRSRKRPPGLVAAAKDAVGALKDLRVRRKALRTQLFASAPWQAEDARISEWASIEGRRLRAESGLYWGTYLLVEQSMARCRKGAPPRFMRWTGDGHIAVQIQHGLSVTEAFACGDGRLRIEPLPTTGSKAAQKRTRVHLRVGSFEDREPIFAVIPVVLHRAMPSDAKIKWVHLIRRRIATQCEWRVQFLLARESWDHTDSATSGEVGIDVGWRMREDGSLRVAYWLGSDGDEGELALPPDWLTEMDRVERIRSHRDINFNAARDMLAGWLRVNKAPDWLAEGTSTLAQWRAPARLAALVLRWRDARFTDDSIYSVLEDWRKRDKHLYEYEGNLRDQLQRRREDIYRKFAAKMRRTYKTACLEALDLRDFHLLPKVEDPAVEGALREHTRDACLSSLRACLCESMSTVVQRDAKDTTRLCPKCKHIGTAQRALWRTCDACGHADDQDRSAALNLLHGNTSAAVM